MLTEFGIHHRLESCEFNCYSIYAVMFQFLCRTLANEWWSGRRKCYSFMKISLNFTPTLWVSTWGCVILGKAHNPQILTQWQDYSKDSYLLTDPNHQPTDGAGMPVGTWNNFTTRQWSCTSVRRKIWPLLIPHSASLIPLKAKIFHHPCLYFTVIAQGTYLNSPY